MGKKSKKKAPIQHQQQQQPRFLQLQPLYRHRGEQADAAFRRGKYREAATLYAEAFRSAPDEWSDHRVHFFFQISSILQEHPSNMLYENDNSDNGDSGSGGQMMIKKDLKFLERVLDAVEEPFVVRSEAALTLGCLLHDKKHASELAADFLRQAIHLCDSASPDERRRTVFIDGTMKQVAAILVDTKDIARSTLAILEDGPGVDPNPRGGTVPKLLTDNVHRMSVGGDRCDSCDRTMVELGMTLLDCCQRCGMAYYCSPDCQRTRWRAGHKLACRAKGQIEAGDAMQLKGLEARPEMNGRLVRVVGPDEKKPGRWRVELEGVTPVSASADNLFRIRPTM